MTRTRCRLGTTYHLGPAWARLTVLNRFEAYSLYFRRKLLAFKPIDYSAH